MNAPQSFAITVVSPTRIDLSWTDPDFPTPPPDSIVIQRKAAGGSYATIDSDSAGTDSYSDTNCVQSVHYYYRAAYYRNGSAVSSWAMPKDGWTPPAPITGVTLTIDGLTATLAWTNGGTYDYVHYIGSWGGTGTAIAGSLTTITDRKSVV